MEAWRCRRENSITNVAYLSLADLDTGNDSIFTTAKRAARGVREDANPARIWKLEYDVLKDSDDEIIASLQRAMVSGATLVASIPVYRSFLGFRDASETVVYAPAAGETTIDGHAVCIIGYDTPRNAWLIKNSDPSWGHGGFGLIRMLDDDLQVERALVCVNEVTQ